MALYDPDNGVVANMKLVSNVLMTQPLGIHVSDRLMVVLGQNWRSSATAP